MTTVADLASAMETIAPLRLAESWDNVGLLVGDPVRELSGVLLTIDCTHDVLREAASHGYGAIVAYHPPIFEAQKRFVAGSIAHDAARENVAIYSPHTALDAVSGGTHDLLADAAGMGDRTPLRLLETEDAEFKLVTFVPGDHVDAVSSAIFAAGAGRIGKYSSCSFRAPGTGTFFGEEGTRPAVGATGRFEQTTELRLETVVPKSRAAAVVRALRAAHPYEEPAFDLVRLAAPEPSRGYGRVGKVPPTTSRALIERLKTALGLAHVLAAGPLDAAVTRVAVCAGSGGDFVTDAVAAGADVFVTGELRHHDVLRATASRLAAVCVLHSASERQVLIRVKELLQDLLPDTAIALSREDREPFVFA